MKMAEVRKKEEERRIERGVQRERQAEGEAFADKEQFVTSAYRQKLIELREAEEKERREAELEGESSSCALQWQCSSCLLRCSPAHPVCLCVLRFAPLGSSARMSRCDILYFVAN